MRAAKPTNLALVMDPAEKLRMHSVLFLLGLVILGSIFNGVILVASGDNLIEGGGLIATIAIFAALILFYFVQRQRFVVLIGSIAVLYIMTMSFLSFIDQFDLMTMMFMLALISAAFIMPLTVYGFFNIVAITLLLSVVFWGDARIVGENQNTGDAIALAITLAFATLPLIVGGIIRYILQAMEQTTLSAQRTASLLEASASISQNVSQMLQLHDLLVHAAQVIRDRFAFFHVQIFLVNAEYTFADLVASPGVIGERLLAQNYRTPVDSSNIIGRVILSREAIVARDARIESLGEAAANLVNARSELALPIQDNDGVIGVIDIYSHVSNAFTGTEMRVLTVIANQLATAIRNARLFERQAENLSENKRLFIESETNLREIQRLNRQLTRQAWADYLQNHRRVSGITHDGQEFAGDVEWTDLMRDASRRRRPIAHDEQEKRIVSVPIELRGEVIGAIEIETQNTQRYDDSVDLMQAISQRLAISLDNARLFEETQEATAQEQRIGELVAQFQSAGTVDDLLRITLEGLRDTLGASEASIRLGFLTDALDKAVDVESRETGKGTSS